MTDIPKIDGQSEDIVADNVEALRALFPEAFTEAMGSEGTIQLKIDFEVLRQLLGDRVVREGEGKYGLSWYGKDRARQLALTPSAATLRPAPEESVDWDTTQNIMIEGDNLEVLKLLQKSYAGRVKLIYIDPPYNTGNDFVYPDDFRDTIGNYLTLTRQSSDSGGKLTSNPETSGRFHTDWLNMIYPRLKLARDFLKKDGAIFVSCDEAEHPRLRVLLDETFGPENFVADFVWAAGRKNDSRLVSISHEYIVVYARDASHLKSEKIEWRQRKKGLEAIYGAYEMFQRKHGSNHQVITNEMKAWFKALPDGDPSKSHKHYCHSDARGLYFPADISWPGGGGPKYEVLHPKTRKPVSIPTRGWITGDPRRMQEWIDDDRVHFGIDERSIPCMKSYLKEKEFAAPYSVFYQDGRASSKRLRTLMGADCFDFPKDENVLQEIIGMMSSADDIVFDFFAGSGTTAHAVMAQNNIDQQSRRSVLVQLPEPLDPENKDQKIAADFCNTLNKPCTIAELTKERLRRAGAKIKAESPLFTGDAGFRVFKLDRSNIRAWDPDTKDLAADLLENVNHLIDGRSDQDILYEVLLKQGLDLCVPMQEQVFGGHKVWCIGAGVLFVCLSDRIDRPAAEAIADGVAKWHEALNPATDTRLIFKDSGFLDDVAKTNLTAILSQHGLKDVRSI